jgi:hypothetical protein
MFATHAAGELHAAVCADGLHVTSPRLTPTTIAGSTRDVQARMDNGGC